jgi:hypothetical protein
MTPKENRNENLPKLISGIFGKKIMGTHCNALQPSTVGTFHTKEWTKIIFVNILYFFESK